MIFFSVLGFFLPKLKPVSISFSLKYDSSKKINYVDVMIFKRFQLHRKKPELCNICK